MQVETKWSRVGFAVFWGVALVALVPFVVEHGWGGVLLWVFCVIAAGVVLYVVRVLASMLGLGRWMCSLGWHWWREFPIHQHFGFGTRTTTYLAVGGVRIRRCRACELYDPSQGEHVHQAFQAGIIQMEGGGVFSGPKLRYRDRPPTKDA